MQTTQTTTRYLPWLALCLALTLTVAFIARQTSASPIDALQAVPPASLSPTATDPPLETIRINNLLRGDDLDNVLKLSGFVLDSGNNRAYVAGILPQAEVDVYPLDNAASSFDWGVPFGFLDAPLTPDEYGELGNQWAVMGSRWAYWEDIETTPGNYNWAAVDLSSLQQTDAFGVRMIPELRSINSLYGTYWQVDEYPEGNVDAWENFVTELVEKFDGDGVDDLTGAPTILTYSFLHELEPGGVNYWTSHPDEYAEMFDVTYRAVKTACQDCVLFLPGGSLGHFRFQDEGAPTDGWIVEVLGYLASYATQFDDLGFDYHIWASTPSPNDPYGEGTDYRDQQNPHRGHSPHLRAVWLRGTAHHLPGIRDGRYWPR